MKGIAISDLHGDHVTEGVPRFDDIHGLVFQVLADASNRKVDRVFFLGDLCDPDKNFTTLRCVRLSITAALWLAERGIRSHWIPGNHCVIEDGSGTTVLSPLKALEAHHDAIRVHEEPGFGDYGGLDILHLPYTPLSHTYDPEEIVRDAYRLRGSIPSRPLIVLSHLSVVGIIPGEETTEMPRGRDILLPHKLIGELFPESTILQGHYHRRQKFENVNVVGSLGVLTFGEEAHRPGYLLVEV